jgi:hypothetical protein
MNKQTIWVLVLIVVLVLIGVVVANSHNSNNTSSVNGTNTNVNPTNPGGNNGVGGPSATTCGPNYGSCPSGYKCSEVCPGGAQLEGSQPAKTFHCIPQNSTEKCTTQS